ncbi:hypothetical protein LTR95_008365 [Oleoguttula sp. CCFEE 5521]
MALRAAGLATLLVATRFLDCLAQDTDYFINPPNGPCKSAQTVPVYTIGEIAQLNWVTALDSMTVTLWQGVQGFESQGSTNYPLPGAQVYKGQSMAWQVGPAGFDLTISPTFHLAIFEVNATSFRFSSSCFNMTEAVVTTSSSTSSSTSTTTSISSTSSTATTSATADAAITSPAAPTQTGSSTNTTAIGVGVGVGVAALLAGLAIGYIVFRRRRNKVSSPNSAPAYPPDQEYRDQTYRQGAPIELENKPFLAEMSTEQGESHELPGHDVDTRYKK